MLSKMPICMSRQPPKRFDNQTGNRPLNRVNSKVWIVDPHRGNRPAFNRRMAHLGFVLSEQRLDRLATLTQTAYKGRLLTYLRSVPKRA